jgi:hypothetical protein
VRRLDELPILKSKISKSINKEVAGKTEDIDDEAEPTITDLMINGDLVPW